MESKKAPTPYADLIAEISEAVIPDWLSYSEEDWKVVAQVFELHFHLENIINLLLTIYFLGTSSGEKPNTFLEVVLKETDFLKKLRMIQRLGWIDGKSYSIAMELNNFRRDFAHPKGEPTIKQVGEFRKSSFFKKYVGMIKSLIKLVVIKDKTYDRKVKKLVREKMKKLRGV